jgi:nitrogen-specific signal transduction histidine kinase/CheY-like chemotaxis protein
VSIDSGKTRIQLLGELEQLRCQIKELQEKDGNRRKQFIANVSHELRTPLNGVMGMIGLLLDSGLKPEQKELADLAKESAVTLMDTINNILNFSTMDNGNIVLKAIDFDLHTTLNSLYETLMLRAREKGLILDFQVSLDIPSLLRGDAEQLRQILAALVGNGIKFTQKGSVKLEVSLDKQVSDNDIILLFTVSDTGTGIAPEEIETLFQPFTQADGSSTRRFGGTGIGLTIAQKLIQMMGGKIHVESQLGQGSIFSFNACFKPQVTASVGSLEPESLPDISDRRILVLDDKSINRQILSRMIAGWGCRYDEAHDAFSALEQLQAAVEANDPYHFLLLDMQMPGMDGETLGTVIKQDVQLQQTTLVMLTSMGQRGDAVRMEKIGFAAYLPKPVESGLLFDCLTALTAESKNPANILFHGIITRHTLAEARRKTK